MWSAMVERMNIAMDLEVARRRAWALTPFSPAWDAAMAIVEDLERALWRVDHPDHGRALDLGRADAPLFHVMSSPQR